MLTKQDLQAISQLLDNKITPLEKRLHAIEEKMTDMELKIDDNKDDVEHQILMLRGELQEGLTQLKRRLKKLEDKVDVLGKVHDSFLQDARRRVMRIEDHLKLPPFNP